jgi:glutamine synthetase adenylyltransferase
VTVGSDWLMQTLGRRMVAAVVDWAVAEMAKRRGVRRRSAIAVVAMGELGKTSQVIGV